MKNSAASISVVALSIVLVVACGGSAASPSSTCIGGSTSTPGGKDDPCAQRGTTCAAIGGVGVAVCDASTRRWGQCTCQMSQAATATPGLVATTSCGNGVVETSAGEQCEVGGPSLTCASMLGVGATGTVLCVGCKFSFAMCSAAANPAGGAGMGAAQGGGGM